MATLRLLILPLAWLACQGTGLAADGWESRLAHRLSGRLAEIEREVADIDAELPDLPALPMDDQGGSGGFATLQIKPEGEFAMTVAWRQSAAIDLVALIPARRFDIDGLHTQYGLPDAFRVELLDASGAVAAEIGHESDLWADGVRQGHPFLYPVEPAVEAAGLRITATRLAADPDRAESYVHAWAEAFAFAGGRNVAIDGRVSKGIGQEPGAPWHWHPGFLIDEQTPLGLPELPGSGHRDIGWLSRGLPKADEVVWVELDLGEVKAFDTLRLFPAKRPTQDLPGGFGFPKKLRIGIANDRGSMERSLGGEIHLRNPGYSPVTIPLGPARGRYVRLQATELWKAFDSFPAYFALSEIEVLDGDRNVALGAAARSPHDMGVVASGGRFWTAASLCDGFGPDGRLVPTREWLEELDQRLSLEHRRERLQREAVEIVADWRRTGLTVSAVIGGLGAFALIFLPIRYRIRARKVLQGVRERIAGDLHDEVGSNLGSIQMFADLAEGRSGPSEELKRIQRIAAETVSAVRDIVWLLRPNRGARIGTAEHLRETASIMLERLDWKFSANEAAWQCELSDEASRHLFLFFREALHNILRHAKAGHVILRVEDQDGRFILRVADDGVGIPAAKLERASTLRALRQRAEGLHAEFEVDSTPDEGTRLVLSLPLKGNQARKRRKDA